MATNTITIPAPVKGLNKRDPIDIMGVDEAITLVNWIPQTDALRLRQGYEEYCDLTGTNPVQTMAIWSGITGSKLIVSCGGDLYNVLSAGSGVVLTSGMSSFSVNAWQTENFSNNLIFVNGTDAPVRFDGTAVTALSVSATGLSVNDLIYALSFKGRMYYVEKDTSSFWYGGLNQISGSLTEVDLKTIAMEGGYLVALGSWSRDSGDGMEDLFVAVMSTGELIVYQGSYPGDSSWARVGSYKAPQPIGRRCLDKFGGELVVLTKQGAIPVSLAMQDAYFYALENHKIWGKIRKAIEDDYNIYGDILGYQILHMNGRGMGLINIPTIENMTSKQYVMNTINGAWCEFNNVNGIEFIEYNNEVLFSAENGKIYRMRDNIDDNGSAISAKLKTSFSYLDDRVNYKKFNRVKLQMLIGVSATGSIGIDVDQQDRPLKSNTNTFNPIQDGVYWNLGDWDTSEWASAPEPYDVWHSIARSGRSVSFKMNLSAPRSDIKFYSLTYSYEVGGIR